MQIHLPKRLLAIFAGVVLFFTLPIATPMAFEENDQPKIRIHRIARISDGMNKQAFKFAKEVTQYLNNRYPQISAQVYVEAFGTVGTIHWFGDYKDLATLEQIISKVLSDEGYKAILRRAVGLFVEGSAHDTLLIRMP